jgi:uncharacterized protein YukE
MPTFTEAEFRRLLDTTDARLTDIAGTVDTLFERGDFALRLLPPGLSDGLHEALASLRDLVVRFFAEVNKLLLNPGWPPGLKSAADSWTATIGGPISGLSAELGADQLRIDNFWKGPAADAYASTLPAQRKAIEAIAQAAGVLDSTLTKIANGIYALWLGLIVALVQLAIEFGAEAGAASTVVGAPPAAAAAGVSTVKVIGIVAALCGGFAAYISLVIDGMATMRQTLWADNPFPGGRWPHSTTSDFSDGSLTDGDTTEWRLKTDD